MKQTAVEWLVCELQKADWIPKDSVIMNYVIEQSKEMEKKQHYETWFESTAQFSNEAEMLYKKDFEQYYNETFKNKKDMKKVLELKTPEYLQKDTVFLSIDKNQNEILKLCPNGDIFVKGRLAENDKEVVDALKEWLNRQGFKI